MRAPGQDRGLTCSAQCSAGKRPPPRSASGAAGLAGLEPDGLFDPGGLFGGLFSPGGLLGGLFDSGKLFAAVDSSAISGHRRLQEYECLFRGREAGLQGKRAQTVTGKPT